MRLRGYDYSRPGAYFVTICTFQRFCLFGEITADTVRLTALGNAVENTWRAIPGHNPHVELDSFVVMPNHVHGILCIREYVGAKHASPLPVGYGGSSRGSLSAIIQGLKSSVSRGAHRQGSITHRPIWQRGFHDRVIRDEAELERIRSYIEENPLRWSLDEENPDRRA
jgi:putative transposase